MPAARQGNEGTPEADLILSTDVIRAWVGQRSMSLGREYADQGAVFNCRRQGPTINARCRGQSADSYKVRASLRDGRILSARCSCPVGDGGQCKHAAAMLLTFLRQPD